MDTISWGVLARRTARQNEQWVRENMPPNVQWAIVVGGDIVDTGDFGGLVPSAFQTREKSTARRRAYLVMRPSSYLDTDLFFRSAYEQDILGIFERDPKHAFSHLDESEGIMSLRCRSGVLSTMEEGYALGMLKVQKPKREDGEGQHTEGATVCTVRNMLYRGKPLYIAAQPAALVHRRGKRTQSDRDPDRAFRIERHHRFDDPVLDIMDTYDIEMGSAGEQWPPLVLYKSRK
jgi:hypothetical protein